MFLQYTGKGTLWKLRLQNADPSDLEGFVRSELEDLLAGGDVRSILLVRGDTTSEGTEFWMLLDKVLEGHADVITKIERHYTISWKPFGVRTFNHYGEEKNLLSADRYGEEECVVPELAGYGQEKNDDGQAK
jgi:hypothetical protein